jgi:enoyl-CoA hydratase
MSVLKIQIIDFVAIVTLNRPEARNSLNPELICELSKTWVELSLNPEIRAVVLTGADGTTFCSGFDLSSTIPIINGTKKPTNDFENAVAEDPSLMGKATLRDYDIGKPLIAAVNGHAIAGGMELMLSCDIRVVATQVKLGLSEVALGMIPAMGGTAKLARHLPTALALEMILTAKPMISDRLAESGLINRLEEPGKVLSSALEIAQLIASNAPLAAQEARSVLLASADLTVEEALSLEESSSSMLMATEDAVEGPRAFLEKRAPTFKGR